MLRLRTSVGIEAEEYQRDYRMDFTPLRARLEEYRARGWAEEAEGRWRLTPEGFLLSNQLIGGLLECQEEDTFASVLRRQAGRPAERGQNG